MLSATSDVEKTLATIIKLLDTASQKTAPPTAEHRGERRWPLRTGCELWTCSEEGRKEAGRDVVTRNISFRGLSVVGNLTRPLWTGQPIEAAITMVDLPRRHVAGTVVFCRQVHGDCYEVGIHVRAVGSSWIIVGDIEASKDLYDWFAKAWQAPYRPSSQSA